MSDAGKAECEINRRLLAVDIPPLDPAQAQKFGSYMALIVRWNARTNLTAVRDESGIIERHFGECIACAHALPKGIATLLDLGSGAGFPGIPIALCRPEIAVSLAESQGKKAAFLKEAVRVLGLQARVHGGRAEELHEEFDCVTLRAVDRMQFAVTVAADLVRQGGWLAPMTTSAELAKIKAAGGNRFTWSDPTPLPGSEDRVLVLGHKELALTRS